MADVTRLREMAEQARTFRLARLAEAVKDAAAADAARRGPHAPGDRVFDTQTGLEGEVLHAARENVLVPAARKSAG